MREITAASGPIRTALAGSALLVTLAAAPAVAQYGSPTGEKTQPSPGAYPTPARDPHVDDTGGRTGPTWNDADFAAITPESGRLDTVLVRSAHLGKHAVAFHRIRSDAASRFRVATLDGPSVMRVRVSFITDVEKPDEQKSALLIVIDDQPSRTFAIKAKRFRSATVGEAQRWISDPRVVDVPLPEGHHVIDVRRADGATEVVGVFEMPIVQAE